MDNEFTTYLGGRIFGCTDEQCRAWREQAKKLLITRVRDPLRADHRANEREQAATIVATDLQDLHESDFLLVNAVEPGWGTAMEIFYAWQQGKFIVAYVGNILSISPWLRVHCSEIVSSLEIACTLINAKAGA